MRVLVTGSRDWDKPGLVQLELERAFLKATDLGEDLLVIHGDCPTGADAQAEEWVQRLRRQGLENVDSDPHPADWKGPRKKGAGFARNAEMVKLGADLCLAFILNESTGSTHCSQLADKAGIETKTFRRSNNSMAQRQRKYIPEMQLDGVRLIWRNFEGREDEFNAPGQRNFHVVLPEDVALEMTKQGWNVKSKPPKEEGEETFYYLKVKVSFRYKAPRLTTVSKKWDHKLGKEKLVRNLLPENLVMTLDMFEFEKVDLILTPSHWGPNHRGESGVTAYVKTGFFFVKRDALEEKYAYIPEEDMLAIEGPDPANDWVEGEIVSETEEIDELEDPWEPKAVAS